jgi:peptidoglycan hydrolase-like protein with peptidoglycan-binding domain
MTALQVDQRTRGRSVAVVRVAVVRLDLTTASGGPGQRSAHPERAIHTRRAPVRRPIPAPATPGSRGEQSLAAPQLLLLAVVLVCSVWSLCRLYVDRHPPSSVRLPSLRPLGRGTLEALDCLRSHLDRPRRRLPGLTSRGPGEPGLAAAGLAVVAVVFVCSVGSLCRRYADRHPPSSIRSRVASLVRGSVPNPSGDGRTEPRLGAAGLALVVVVALCSTWSLLRRCLHRHQPGPNRGGSPAALGRDTVNSIRAAVNSIRAGLNSTRAALELPLRHHVPNAAHRVRTFLWTVAAGSLALSFGQAAAGALTIRDRLTPPRIVQRMPPAHRHVDNAFRVRQGSLLLPGAGAGLRDGSPAVRQLQRGLSGRGYRLGPVDGRFGPRTEAAVVRLQGDLGLPVDGLAGPRTLAAVATPNPTLYPGAGVASGGSNFVRALQRRLATAGIDPGPVDGLYGPRTEGAVRRFQTTHWMRVDGVAGRATLAALSANARHRQPLRRHAHVRPSRPRHSHHVRVSAARPTTVRHASHPVGITAIAWLGLLAALGLASVSAILHARRRPEEDHAVSPAAPQDSRVGSSGRGDLGDSAAGALQSQNGGSAATAGRAAAETMDADGIYRLAVLLEEQKDLGGAEEAYRRADRQGHAAAASNLGVLLEQRGDLSAAEAAYHRADERGDATGAFNLGLMLEERNNLAGAEEAYRRADRHGLAAAASNLGVLLERRGDLSAAEAAYRRADRRGDANGAFNLAVLLEERNELERAEAAYHRADERGHADVANTARAALLELRAAHNGSNGHSSNGHGSSGHSSNGHGSNGHSSNGHGSNGHQPR